MATQKQQDITKSGLMNYRQLLNLNDLLYSNEDLDTTNNILKALNGTSNWGTTESLQSAYSGPIYDSRFESLYSKTPFGKSMFDLGVITDSEAGEWEDIRAKNLPWYSKMAAGISKGATLAGTTFIDGTLGLLYGIGDALFDYHDRGDGSFGGAFSRIWDNDITQAMDSINKEAENVLPNYYSKEEMEGPWYNNIFTANTIFDKLVKNTGFMIGAAYSGGLYSKGIGALARGIGEARGLMSGAEALGTSKLGALTNKLPFVKTDKAAQELMIKGALAMESSNAARSTKATVGAFFNAVSEGTVEAVGNSNDWTEKQKQRIDLDVKELFELADIEYLLNKGKLMIIGSDGLYYDKAWIDYLNKLKLIREGQKAAYALIEKDRTKMGNADLLFNIPILWTGDIMTFGKMYAGGWRAARNEAKTVTKATKQALADAKATYEAGDKDAIKNLKAIVNKAEKTGYRGLSDEEKALVELVRGNDFSIFSPIKSIAERNKYTGYAYNALKEPLKEGNEEMLQAAASRASGLYYQDDVDNIYNAKVHPESQKKVLDWLDSILQGLGDLYGNIENWEEGFIGAVTGSLGSPTFGKKTNSTDLTWLGRNRMIGMSGGIITQIRDYNKERQSQEQTAWHIDRILKSDSFKNRFLHLVALTTFDNEKNQAIIHDNKKLFKDAETASIFEDIMYFKKGDRLDLLQRALENTELFEDEDILAIIDLTTSAKSAYNEFISEDINKRNSLLQQLDLAQEKYDLIFGDDAYRNMMNAATDAGVGTERSNQIIDNWYAQQDEAYELIEDLRSQILNYNERIDNSHMTEYSPYIRNGEFMEPEEIKNDILKRANKVNLIIKDISQAQDEIDNSTGGVYTDEQLTTLTWYKIMMRDWERRSSNMAGNLSSFIQTMINNPYFKNLIDFIDSVISAAEQSGMSRESLDTFGGKKKATLSFLQYGQSLLDILSNIKYAVSQEIMMEEDEDAKYGIALARNLASDKLIDIPIELSEDGKVTKAEKTTLGKYLMDSIDNFIKNDPTYTEDQKEPIKKMLLELKEIGESYGLYNKLLDEYRKDPEKIDRAHLEIDNRNAGIVANKAAGTIAERFNWNASIGEIAKTLDENEDDINNIGGLDKFIKTLPLELQKIIRDALKLRDGIKSFKEYVDDSDMEDNLKNIANSLIDENTPNINDIESLANAITDSINNGDVETLANSVIDEDTDDIVRDELIQEFEELIADFFNLKLQNVAEAMDKQEKYQREIERLIELGIEEGKIPTNSGDNTPVDIEQKITLEQEFKEPTETEFKVPGEDEINDFDDSVRTRLQWDKKANGKEPSFSEPKFAKLFNIPQISEYLLRGYDLLEILDAYRKHPNMIPKGIDKDAFLKYVEETHKYLKINGAFEYVKHLLKQGDNLRFTIDLQLNKDAGTTVVLIEAEDSSHNWHVVGSIESQLDFDAYKYALDKGEIRLNKIIEAHLLLFNAVVNSLDHTNGEEDIANIFSSITDLRELDYKKLKDNSSIGKVNQIIAANIDAFKDEYDLYKSTGDKSKMTKDSKVTPEDIIKFFDDLDARKKELSKHASYITTKVSKLMSGDLARSSSENSLADTFRTTTPEIAVIRHSLLDVNNTSRNELLQGTRLNYPVEGLVYALIPSNNGVVPALCYSTPINSLADDDPFILKVVDILDKLTSSTVKKEEYLSEFFKYMRLPNLHVAFLSQDEFTGRFTEVEDASLATKCRLSFKKNNGKTLLFPFNLINGHIPLDKLREFVFRAATEFRQELKEGDNPKNPSLQSLTVNVARRELLNQEYLEFIKPYLHTNLIAGEAGTHTINDYFNWEDTSVERLYKGSEKKVNPLPIVTTPLPRTSIMYGGNEYLVDASGIVSLNGSVVDSETAKQVRQSYEQAKVGKADKVDKVEVFVPSMGASSSFGSIDLGGTSLSKEEANKLSTAFLGISSGQKKSTARPRFGGRPKPKGPEGEVSESSPIKFMEESIAQELVITHQLRLQEKDLITNLLPLIGELNIDILHQGMINAIDSNGNPVRAFGMFKNGVLTISDRSPRGTTFHEAYHYVIDFLMTEEELNKVLYAAKELFTDIKREDYKTNEDYELALEERTAEKFRGFMNGLNDKSIGGRFRSFFRKIGHLIKSLFGSEQYLDTIFWLIYNNKFADRLARTNVQAMKFAEDRRIKELNNGHPLSLAPNGLPSKLYQSLLDYFNGDEQKAIEAKSKVYSKNFFNWFGDWINDPENSSKVVDENGEPLVVYHNGARDIKIFKGDKDEYENIYFGDYITSASYGGSETTVFLNVKSPTIVEGNNEEIGDATEKIYGTRRINPQGSDDGVIYHHVKDVGDGVYDMDEEMVDKFWFDYEKQGYGTVYSVKNPNQIKSAIDNNGEFSTTNDKIKFMKSFEDNFTNYRTNKFSYDNLTLEEKDYLEARKISLKDYEELSNDLKETLLHCM